MDAVNKSIEALRNAIKNSSAVGKGQRTGTGKQNNTVFRSVEIMGLPVNIDEFNALQVLDEGANFGKFYFMEGFSQEGGSDIRR
jgi:hypothetical protein